MGKCKFEEAIKEMKTFIQERMKGKFVSADTKDVLQAKLDEIAKMELMVRKLQGTVRVTGSKAEVKVETKQEKGKIDVTDPIATMKAMQEMKLEKEESNMNQMWMIGAKESIDRNVRTYNTWKEKDVKWLKSHGFPVPKKLVTGDVDNKYYNAIDYLVKETTKPGVNVIADLTEALSDTDKIKFAKYDQAKNEIIKYTYTNASIQEYLKNSGVEAFVDSEMVDGNIEDKAVMETALKSNKDFMELLVGTSENNEEYVKLWADYLTNRSPAMVSHELVHAGSSKYMLDNPNSELTKKMEELYSKALERKDYINEVTGGDDYWSTNVHEFVAEGLTNPLVMQALNGLKYDVSRNSIFRDLVDAALKMLGFGSGTMYNGLLESYLQIVREKKEFSPEIKEMAKRILQGMKDC